MGAMSAGEAGYAVLPALDTYAQAIGPAFQVQDDILDVIGHTDVIGKAVQRRRSREEHISVTARAESGSG